jgi:hypothetical protein
MSAIARHLVLNNSTGGQAVAHAGDRKQEEKFPGIEKHGSFQVLLG